MAWGIHITGVMVHGGEMARHTAPVPVLVPTALTLEAMVQIVPVLLLRYGRCLVPRT